MDLSTSTQSRRATRIVLALCLAVVVIARSAASSSDSVSVPAADSANPVPFVATYDVRANGLIVGTSTVSLSGEAGDTYLLTQKSTSRGLGALLAQRMRTETSRWRLVGGRIQAMEYRSQLAGGDDEENAHLLFDWSHGRARNIGGGEHWEVELTPGMVDPLLMQMAMAIDLAGGQEHLAYRVPRQGRIKTYVFERAGEETIVLEAGSFRTQKLMRADDEIDRTVIWSAPDLGYLAVRISKERAWNVDTDVRLRKLERPARGPVAARPGQAPPSARL